MGKRKSINPRKKKKRSTVKKVTGGYTVDLPVEMITMLFKHMLRVDQGLLATCLEVCKLWKAIGTPILYKNIYVVDYHHYLFFRSIANDANGISRHVKSLTLHTYDTFGWYTGHSYFMKAIHIDIPAPSEGFPTCTGMFDLLPAMETLSIVCDERTEMPCLEAMLKLVPYTIRSFELNWPSLSPAYHRVRRPTCKDGFHVCHLLRNILPTVKHFQVRGLAICDSIVPERNDFDGKMKCESINIILLHDMYTHTEHRAHKIASRLSKLLNTEESAPDNLKAATVTSLLAKAIMLDEACDSRMAHCDWSAIILRNLVQKLTTTIPIEGAFSIDKFSREVNDRGSAHFMRQPDVTVERGFKDVFAINFEELIQGVVPDYWTEDSDSAFLSHLSSLHGARQPVPYGYMHHQRPPKFPIGYLIAKCKLDSGNKKRQLGDLC